MRVAAIVGPTASGKTELAIRIAERLRGELVSMDSRQVFRHCDIGTNKPTADELRGVPLHGIDMVDPDQSFTVADYQPIALDAISQIAGRGHLPLLQGGTGLYLRAVLDGWNLGGAPPDPAYRAGLEQRLEEEGVEPLDAQLRQIDPAAADRAGRNPRRLIRALEIHAATGRPPSEARTANPPPWSITVLGLDVPLPELDRRIAARVIAMIDGGWLEEISRIRAAFPTADMRRLGHGYPELAAHLEGRLSLEEARESTVRQVRQYARRQLTWFRADSRVTWISPDIEVAIARLGTAMMTAEAS